MKKLNQISAGGIVLKKVNRTSILWLITRHSLFKHWGFPKGLVGDNDSQESKETAALREVKEEGGVEAEIIDHKPIRTKYSFSHEGVLYFKTVFYFLMEYKKGDPKNHDWEVEEANFVSEDKVKSTLSFDTERKAFEKALQMLRHSGKRGDK